MGFDLPQTLKTYLLHRFTLVCSCLFHACIKLLDSVLEVFDFTNLIRHTELNVYLVREVYFIGAKVYLETQLLASIFIDKTGFPTMSELKTFVLENSNGMRVELLNLGARLISVKMPVDGELKEMLVAYKELESYKTDEAYLGVSCGRVANRIGKGRFELNGQVYQLPINNGPNSLHGGDVNFAHQYWAAEEGTNAVTFTVVSADGDQGYPGNVTAKVTYTLTEENEIKVDFAATTDQDTPINMTNHSYFNLGEEDCKDLVMQIKASSVLELDAGQCPTGALVSVAADPDFDFRAPKKLRPGIDTPSSWVVRDAEGYDHCYALDNGPFADPKATLTSEKNGVQLQVFTDQPGIQCYSGRWLGNGELVNYQGVALESQNFPDAINKPHFPDSVLKAGDTYNHHLIFKFVTL